MFHEVIYIV